ncbi:GNAT family N-acetyltransferase [Photobacterium gaetbulicola]|uniref:GNAT family N-acetyltransferase n=1 Tax=Photobacterium gaetbulicola TaxID=1295392 RepID=UPI0005CBC226|nr:GNAT family N-acetyltransferase [Photobacterium gaetbulicola]
MVIIREMDISDYRGVLNLWTQSEGMTLRDADSEENITAYLKRNQGLSFVASDNDKIVGAVLVGTDGRRGYLQHLTVSPSHQSQGIGRQLVESVVSALSRIGISKTHLFVHSCNVNAQQFYLNMGWFPRDEVRMFSFNSSKNLDV